ncbi:MAG: flagellar hook-length control protein FliK [Xanthobacteraceae bacterium]|nr:flagellar hook-length control protein FliK [Xanthobacteraceae bacterium]
MASVSSVASADFRTSLLPAQNNAPDAEGDDPFSQLLNAVGNGNTNGSNASAAAAPDAPRAAERRDAPAKQQKSDAGDDRQAKRNAKQTDKPEAKTQTETSAPVKQPASEDDSDDTDADTAADDSAAADALLLALNETQPQAAAAADATDAGGATPAAADAQAPVTDGEGALAAAIADAAASEKQRAQTAQNTAPVKGQVEAFAASLQAEPEAEALPAKTAADTLSSLPKTVKTAAHFEAASQIQGQPQPQTSANLATTNAVHAPAPLEMLTAALSKHSQLTAAHDGVDAAPDTQKPLISSNAVAPNFALTTQVAAPISVQTQQAADTARSVPLESLAVEIATRAGKGERRFDIRLDPPELGRIDVRLEIDHKGNTTTKLIVERSETLDLLQRDARGLEKALQNAGLKTDAGGLEFSLRQDTQTQQGQQSHAPDMRGRTEPVQADVETVSEITAGNASLAAQLRGGVDIRI